MRQVLRRWAAGRPAGSPAAASADSGIRQEDRADFEQRDVGQSPADVARRCAEQTRQQRRAQIRLVLRQRIGDAHGGAARIVGVETRAGRRRRRRRTAAAAPRRKPASRQRGRDPAASPLGGRQPAPGRRPRQRDRDASIALEPQHFLDQIGRAGEVGTPRRRLHDRADRLPATRAADVGQPLADRLDRIHPAAEPLALAGRQRHRGQLEPVSRPRSAAPTRSAAPSEQHPGGDLGGIAGQLRVDPTLEAARRLGREAVATRRCG